jgi:hypothetical protein
MSKDTVAMWIAFHLIPRRIVYWCAMSVIAHATSGKWSNQIVLDLTAMDAISRWPEDGQEMKP